MSLRMRKLVDEMQEIIRLSIEHLTMVVTTILFASLIAVPTAIVVYKKNWFVNTSIQVVSLLQAFPTLAIFALLVPFLGIGRNVAIVTLVLYAIMPIYLNTINGFKTINSDYYTIADSLNLSERTILFKVEMPYVIVHIISGIRQATIYTISLATIATLIGAGGLGDLIYLGMQQLNLTLTLEGLIPLIIMAIAANLLFNKLEYKLLPRDMLEVRCKQNR